MFLLSRVEQAPQAKVVQRTVATLTNPVRSKSCERSFGDTETAEMPLHGAVQEDEPVVQRQTGAEHPEDEDCRDTSVAVQPNEPEYR